MTTSSSTVITVQILILSYAPRQKNPCFNFTGFFCLGVEEEIIQKIWYSVTLIMRYWGIFYITNNTTEIKLRVWTFHFKGFFCLGAEDEVITDANGNPLPNGARVKHLKSLPFSFNLSNILRTNNNWMIPRDVRLNVQRTRWGPITFPLKVYLIPSKQFPFIRSLWLTLTMVAGERNFKM